MSPGAGKDPSVPLTVWDQIDTACERFEKACLSDHRPRIEDFLQAANPAIREELFKELLDIELEYRRKAGEQISLQEYFQRFPDYKHLVHSTVTVPEQSSTSAGAYSFRPGDRIEEFEIKEELGRGAFGTVYLARQHGGVDREVALKISTLGTQEPGTLAKLEGHPNIVRIYDQRQLHDRNLYLLYMEFVPGETLRSLVGKVSSEKICRLGEKLADALDFAHRRGVLHCDVKPANIILDGEGNPKLVDFNVAKRTNLEQTNIGGTLAYMSPEQLDVDKEADEGERARKAASLDGRSDIYSLGVVLWELLTGQRPFEGTPNLDDWTSTLTALAQERLSWTPGRARAALPEQVPGALRQILARCLAPQPKDRFDSAAELAQELRLSAQAELQDLLYPPQKNLRQLLLGWPLTIALVLGVISNALLAVLNIVYNWEILKAGAPHFSEETFFGVLVPLINTPAFGIGIFIGVYIGWPVIRAIGSLRSQTPETPSPLVVSRCLFWGHYTGLIVLAAWSTASFVWGVVILLHDVPLKTCLHFAGAVFLSGMISAALTFFPVTYFCVRVLLPLLVRETQARIRLSLEPCLKGYLILLVVCPIIAMSVVVLAPPREGHSRPLMISLVALGAAGYLIGQPWSNKIRADLGLLSQFRDRT